MSSEQTVDALKSAYRHLLYQDLYGTRTISENELINILCDAICEEVGDDEFNRWLNEDDGGEDGSAWYAW